MGDKLKSQRFFNWQNSQTQKRSMAGKMAFKFRKTEIEGLLIIEPHIYEDFRGVYKKFYEKEIFRDNGITDEFCEGSDLYSKKGALRGLHYQEGESQSKLIRVISGTLFDVAVDLRVDSPTFGKYHAELLSFDDMKTLYIPKGFAHGFIALEDNTIFSYNCAGKYEPSMCNGILWNDDYLNIKWPLKEYGVNEVITTDRDRAWQTFKEYEKNLGSC